MSFPAVCTPGVSRKTICASGSVSTACTEERVVCGLLETAATFWPTTAFTRVDLPALGRPSTVTKPETCFGFFVFLALWGGSGLLAFTVIRFHRRRARQAHLRYSPVVRG